MKKSRHIVFIILLILLTGCSLLKARGDLNQIRQLSAVNGYVESSIDGRVLTIICKPRKEGYEAIQISEVENEGIFFFDIEEGTYSVFSFLDKNRNDYYDDGELWGAHNRLMPMMAQLDTIPEKITIKIDKETDFPAELPRDFTGILHRHRIHFNEVASLDDDRFSKKNGNLGLWEPLEYIHEIGLGSFTLEPLDAQRIPILFVHGAGGSPLDFWFLARYLDTSRFQPVFFYYPSGVRLEGLGHLFRAALASLHRSGGKNTLVIAHSMGGLVARAGVLEFLAENENMGVSLLITLSTPWAGHTAAAMGVKNSPVVLLNWYDMVPESPFLQQLWNKPLPGTVDFHLLFGFKGNASLVMGNNDGAVTLQSQLDPRAQKEARRIYGQDAGHVEILFAAETVRQISAILEKLP